MDVTIEELYFHHLESTSKVLGSSLDLSFTHSKITAPEWQYDTTKAHSQSIAGYIVNTNSNKIAIKVKIRLNNPSLKKIEIKTENHDEYIIGSKTSDILGQVLPKEVNFDKSLTKIEEFELIGNKLTAHGVGIYLVSFLWKYREEKGEWKNIVISRHKIYAILNTPSHPWALYENNEGILPWIEVLDHACEWAKGEKTEVGIAYKITKYVYEELGNPNKCSKRKSGLTLDRQSGGLPAYLLWNGSSSLDAGNAFNCVKFLEWLNGYTGNGIYINCQDCLYIVITFANILGCNLKSCRIDDDHFPDLQIPIKRILPIGFNIYSSKKIPNKFYFHEIAILEDLSKNEFVFDACLKLWDDLEPQLPVNMVYGSCEYELTYLYRLVDFENPKDCQKIHLYNLDNVPNSGRKVYKPHLNNLKSPTVKGNIEKWKLDNWKLDELNYPATDNPAIASLYYKRKGNNNRQIHINVAEFSTMNLQEEDKLKILKESEALFNSLSKGGMFKLQNANDDKYNLKTSKIGDKALTGDLELKEYIIFRKDHTIVEIRSIGSEHVDVFDIAEEILQKEYSLIIKKS